MDIKDASIEQLKAELVAREKVKRSEGKPKPLDVLDFSWVKKYCADYLNEVENDEAVDSGIPDFIFEAAMEACYGSGVWDWINPRLQ